jgi:hypothetical protein
MRTVGEAFAQIQLWTSAHGYHHLMADKPDSFFTVIRNEIPKLASVWDSAKYKGA